jgi:molybdenum cofactor synthesis domain-containing protein
MRDRTAAIVVIGNEILSGKSQDRNAAFLIGELYRLGVALRRIVIIPDDVEEIAGAVRECASRFDYVFTSGGVGPTHDDLTIEGVARAFGRRIVRHAELVRIISGYCGGQLDDPRLRMADVPEGAELIFAQGLAWPVLALENTYILPGVPEHFKTKFEAIRERFRASPFFLRSVYTREDEFDIAPRLNQVAGDHPDVEIGSYPSSTRDDYRVKITIESKREEAVERALAALLKLLDPDSVVRTE